METGSGNPNMETLSMDGVRETKAHLGLDLTRNMKGNKKHFCKHVVSKIRAGEKVGLLLKWTLGLGQGTRKWPVIPLSKF